MSAPTAKAPWGLRFSIRFLSILLGLLSYWLLGFFMSDIATMEGPDRSAIEADFVDAAKAEEAKVLAAQINALRTRIKNAQTNRKNLEAQATNFKNKAEILDKRPSLSPKDRDVRDDATEKFLAKRTEIDEVNELIRTTTLDEQKLQASSQTLDTELGQQRQKAQREYGTQYQAHRLKVAACKLAVLIPILLITTILLVRRRGTPFAPAFWAPTIATALMSLSVMHDHFPRKVFKYLLMAICLGIVLRVLISIIRKITKPPRDWLQKQYREAYERFLCPVCEYPIRRGPLRFVYWTRRRVRHLTRPEAGDAKADGPYTCPACATTLFDTCPSCDGVRHALLTACEHCGNPTEEPEAESAEGA
jgi:hypothetical protein